MSRSTDEISVQPLPSGASSPGNKKDSSDQVRVLMAGALPTDLGMVKGGVEAVIMNLFAGFSTMKDVRIIHVAHSKETKTPQKIQHSDNIVIHFLPFIVKYELADYFINDRALQQILNEEKPHIIHIQEITPHIIRFLKYPKDNIIITQHGIMHEELKYASGFSQKMKCYFKTYVERYIFPVFKNVIFISKYNQTLYPPKPVHSVQIFNPVNPIFFSDDSAAAQKKNTMVYVGVLSRRKNIRIVIEAMHAMRKEGKIFTLQVIGGFKDAGCEHEINTLINDSGLRDQIIFHGWMKQEEIRKIYSGCPIFILPSLQETLPVSIGEAMALGKVVVATDVGAVNEMFTDKISGFLFKKNDLNDLVTVLHHIYDHPALHAIGERARAEAREKFHPSLIAERTKNFYREVIHQTIAKAV